MDSKRLLYGTVHPQRSLVVGAWLEKYVRRMILRTAVGCAASFESQDSRKNRRTVRSLLASVLR